MGNFFTAKEWGQEVGQQLRRLHLLRNPVSAPPGTPATIRVARVAMCSMTTTSLSAK